MHTHSLITGSITNDTLLRWLTVCWIVSVVFHPMMTVGKLGLQTMTAFSGVLFTSSMDDCSAKGSDEEGCESHRADGEGQTW